MNRGAWVLGSGRAGENDSASIEAQMVNVFEAVLHQQECGRNLRRSRVLELLCPEAPGFQGSTAASHPSPPAPRLQGSLAPRPLPHGSRAPRLPGPAHPCPTAPELQGSLAPRTLAPVSRPPRPPRIPAPALRHRYPSRMKPNRVGLNSGKIWSMARSARAALESSGLGTDNVGRLT